MPSSSATPAARPSFTQDLGRPAAFVRISAPCAFAAAAMLLRDAAHAAADVAPHAADAVALAHDVVEQHVGRARHRRRGERPDDGVGGQRRLQLLRLEPAVEDRPRRAGEDFDGRRPPSLPSLRNFQPSLPSCHRSPTRVANGFGRRLRQHRLEEVGDARQHLLVLRVAPRRPSARTWRPRACVISVSGPIIR